METKVVTGTRGGKVVNRHARNWSSGFQERKKRGNGRNGVGRGGICVSFVKTVGIHSIIYVQVKEVAVKYVHPSHSS